MSYQPTPHSFSSHLAEHNAGIVPAEAKGIGQCRTNGLFASVVRNVAQGAVWVGVIQIDCRRQRLTVECDHTYEGLHGRGRTEQMAHHAFG